MYKQINLGRVVTGTVLLDMLKDCVMSAGLNNGQHEYYYMQGGDLRKARFNLAGVLVSDYVCEISFNNLTNMSMSVAGNVKYIPKTLAKQTEGTFEDAIKQHSEIVCTHSYYTAIKERGSTTLENFLVTLTDMFASEDIAEILSSKTFLIGVNHDKFKKIIKGDN
ncbi:gp81 [Bacillus phage W.Ph.]|uniref:Gp81 n=1 Tax=Bacillus phage W.Ph. TaxID=764595 RepID=G9B1I2_9CAUD|nr:gp81 [Bacillus phage W.Ph.]ADH03227.1 gp81 [Bacillus phage W.Ph.]